MKLKSSNINRFYKIGKAKFLCAFMLLFSLGMVAQQDSTKLRKESNRFVAEAGTALADNQFPQAEASYRKAVSKDPANMAANYNFGNSYYTNNRYEEAIDRYKGAVEAAATKTEKHRAYHNLGNALLSQNQYAAAVKAYKNALRNNPNDDETRYNLAYAKKKTRDTPGDEQPDEDGENQNDQEDGDGGGDQEQDKKDNQSQDGGDGDQDQEEQKDGDQEGNENEPKDDKEQRGKNEEQKQDQQPQQQQPAEGKLSPERMRSLLEAMDNNEKKVQEKVNAQRAKGQPKSTDKDW